MSFLFTTPKPILQGPGESTILKKRILKRYGQRRQTEELGQLEQSHLIDSYDADTALNTTLNSAQVSFNHNTLSFETPPTHSTPKPQPIRPAFKKSSAIPCPKKTTAIPATPISIQKPNPPPIFIRNSTNKNKPRRNSFSWSETQTPILIAQFNRAKQEALNNRWNREEKFNIINNEPLPVRR